MSKEEHGVPQPPDYEKEWAFPTVQKIGIPLLMLIPILALLGLFGNSATTVREQGQTLELETTFPTRLRHRSSAPLVVRATNLSAQEAPTITMKFDQDYLSAFSNVTFQPSVDEVTEEAYFVYLNEVAPGETRLVTVEVQSEEYWRHEGTIAAAAGDAEAQADVVVDVHTFLIP